MSTQMFIVATTNARSTLQHAWLIVACSSTSYCQPSTEREYERSRQCLLPLLPIAAAAPSPPLPPSNALVAAAAHHHRFHPLTRLLLQLPITAAFHPTCLIDCWVRQHKLMPMLSLIFSKGKQPVRKYAVMMWRQNVKLAMLQKKNNGNRNGKGTGHCGITNVETAKKGESNTCSKCTAAEQVDRSPLFHCQFLQFALPFLHHFFSCIFMFIAIFWCCTQTAQQNRTGLMGTHNNLRPILSTTFLVWLVVWSIGMQLTSNYGGGGATTAAATDGKQNNNLLLCSGWASNNGRMIWRMTATEEMR
jgi:hypothetical protein